MAQKIDIPCSNCFTEETETHVFVEPEESRDSWLNGAMLALVTGAGVLAILEVRNHGLLLEQKKQRSKWRMTPGEDEQSSWSMLETPSPDVPSSEAMDELCDWLFNCPLNSSADTRSGKEEV